MRSIVDYAVSISEPEEIILFGSVANGSANIYSDVDLLIISDSGISKDEATKKIEVYSSRYSLKTDVLFYSLADFEREVLIPDSFIKAVYKAGLKVYQKKHKIPLKRSGNNWKSA